MTARIHDSILDTIGDTPVIRLNRMAPEGVELYVKVEAFNPGGSVKDRLALGIIEAAEKDGSLKPGQTVIDATSGNTGIGLAVVCAQKGYPLVVTMAESFSVERRKLMRFLGARVVLTPAAEKGFGMYRKAQELAEANGWFLARQFENPANPGMHERTTGREIVEAFGPDGLDYFVTGFGTGGTLTGVARTLRRDSAKTMIVATEPDNYTLLASGQSQGFNPDGSPMASHPAFRPHLMQGWSPDFISKVASESIENAYVDIFQPVSGQAAMDTCRELARKEGIFCGTSGGATLAGALEIARTAPKGSKILAMLPDTGERYLSTPLFADVPEAMTDEEKALSRQTPTAQFGAGPAPAGPKPGDPTPEAMEDAQALIASAPVVVFALEWCEFSWSVRKMFGEAGIDYRSVDLDSVEYQKGGRGAALRAALRKICGAPTIPQVFVNGAHVGGATETFDLCNSGRLAEMLAEADLTFIAAAENAYSYLPKWLHPR